MCRLFGLLLASVLLAPGAAPLLAADDPAEPTLLELRDGDRVVLLGNTLIEREQRYGYWETMLTACYPDRTVTFRNLGWDGDTVWAESRGIFDPPAAGYARMIEQVKGLKPTVIFLGYGQNEFLDQRPVNEFVAQYEKLLDDLKKAAPEGVRFVILTPTRLEQKPPPLPDVGPVNQRLGSCCDALKGLAERRGLPFVDLFFEAGQSFRDRLPSEPQTDDGMHLNDVGYFRSALRIAALTGARLPFTTHIVIDSDGRVDASSSTTTVKDLEIKPDSLRFTLTDERLPLFGRPLGLSPLTGGSYRFSVDGKPVTLLKAEESGAFLLLPTDEKAKPGKPVWATRLSLGGLYRNFGPLRDRITSMGPETDQIEALRQAIVAKNELYFHSWRPQNVTYLFGFRKHEQGQNAKETAEFEKLVLEKEAEIAKLKKPAPHKYEFVREK